jgi:hypothetical protein
MEASMLDPHVGLELVRIHGRELSQDYRRASRAQKWLSARLSQLFGVVVIQQPPQHSPRQVRSA